LGGLPSFYLTLLRCHSVALHLVFAAFLYWHLLDALSSFPFSSSSCDVLFSPRPPSALLDVFLLTLNRWLGTPSFSLAFFPFSPCRQFNLSLVHPPPVSLPLLTCKVVSAPLPFLYIICFPTAAQILVHPGLINGLCGPVTVLAVPHLLGLFSRQIFCFQVSSFLSIPA